MVNFLERQIKILSHPLFGDISDNKPNPVMRRTHKNRTTLKVNTKGSSFVTSISAPENPISVPTIHKQTTAANNLLLETCLYCEESHLISKCPKLQRISHKEKMEFLKGKGACFGCLKVGHMSKECRNRLTCDKCHLKHPTLLHINNKEPSISSAFVTHQASVCTGAGDHDCTLSIVPVKIKSKKGNKVLQTYAFLDPGSTATFITSTLMTQLNLQGTKTNILLRTMGQEKLVPSHCVTGLEISELGENNFMDLPEVYTQENIPVSKTNIPHQQDIENLEYLKSIKIPELDADVGLLIGMNAPKLMEPWEIINSKGDGPYAVKTLLGWVINGPLRSANGGQRSCPTVYINRISIIKLEDLLKSQYNMDFNEKSLEEEHE
ncbi:uncharacterized protein LOC106534037, partial [Austrofundulus limnaeus]|uniref:Uncharacterized protein LOC106534037 n=1 Tax=Austrofundulus limnaeus TaxID=52670 RepID=A0A2I4D165_AUSLI